MTIKQNGGVFGRNPTFNDVTIEGQLTFDGDIDINSDLKVDGDLVVTGGMTVDTSTLVVDDANNRVGIGTDAPQDLLHITLPAGVNGDIVALGRAANTYQFHLGMTSASMFYIADNSSNIKVGFPYTGGITFNGDTATSNALDDYEEGSFIPEVRFGGASPSGITYAAKTGTYTKIGNVVEFRFIVTLTAKGSQTGNFEVYGLPYVAASSDNGVGVSSFFNNLTFTGEEVPIGRVENSAVVEFRYPSSGLSTRMTNSQIENNTDLRVSGIYKTA